MLPSSLPYFFFLAFLFSPNARSLQDLFYSNEAMEQDSIEEGQMGESIHVDSMCIGSLICFFLLAFLSWLSSLLPVMAALPPLAVLSTQDGASSFMRSSGKKCIYTLIKDLPLSTFILHVFGPFFLPLARFKAPHRDLFSRQPKRQTVFRAVLVFVESDITVRFNVHGSTVETVVILVGRSHAPQGDK